MSSADWVESATDLLNNDLEDSESLTSLSNVTNTGIIVDEEQLSPATEVEPITEQTVLKIRIYRLKK